MKWKLIARATSPLAEGRELKYIWSNTNNLEVGSPLAEGRELKLAYQIFVVFPLMSPLAEGRELKFAIIYLCVLQIAVAPRGGA